MQDEVKEFSGSSRVAVPQRFAFFRGHDVVQFSVAAVVILFLIYQVVTPLGFLVWGSLKTVRPGATGFFSLHLTLSNYVRAVSPGQFGAAYFDSLVFYPGAAS